MAERSKRIGELLEESYRQIAVFEQELKEQVPEAELRDELADAFRLYRKCHHRLRRRIIEVVISSHD